MSENTKVRLTGIEMQDGGQALINKFEEYPGKAMAFATHMLETLADSRSAFEVAGNAMLFAVASRVPGALSCVEQDDGRVLVKKGHWTIGTLQSAIDVGSLNSFSVAMTMELSPLGALVFESTCPTHGAEALKKLRETYGIDLSDSETETQTNPEAN